MSRASRNSEIGQGEVGKWLHGTQQTLWVMERPVDLVLLVRDEISSLSDDRWTTF
jgi:hypothetical protein